MGIWHALTRSRLGISLHSRISMRRGWISVRQGHGIWLLLPQLEDFREAKERMERAIWKEVEGKSLDE